MGDKVTMIVQIDKLERTTQESRKGNQLTGLKVEGTRLKKGGEREPWTKFLNDYYDAKVVESFERLGTGSKAVVVMQRDGRWWKVLNVNPADGGSETASNDNDAGTTSAPNADVPATTSSATMPQAPAVTPPAAVFNVDYERQYALDRSIKLIVGMVEAGLIKGTKATPQVVTENVLTAADMFLEYIQGEVDSEPEADASDLKDENTGTDGSESPVDDEDIPF